MGVNAAKTWFLENGSIVVAICALFISVLSLWFTIDAQNSERLYKEVAIRPHFVKFVDSNKLEISLSNRGLGPAIVQTVKFKFADGTCANVARIDEQWSVLVRRFFAEAYQKLFEEVLAEGGKETGWPFGQIRISMPSPSNSYSAGDTIKLLEIPNGEALIDDLAQVDPGGERKLVSRTQDRFAAFGAALPLEVGYCSATGFYCASLTPTPSIQCR